jgi:hypothetical protein
MNDLHPTNHELMKMVRQRVKQDPPIPMTQIARELGFDVDDLCAWIVAYREPRRPKAYLRRDGPPIAALNPADKQRLANWQRQREAAAEARVSIATPARASAHG